MTLDETLLEDVRRSRERLEELEDAAWEARARFHQSIRRLHRSGGSMREIAGALGMSHQRIHQIVGEDALVEVGATEVAEPRAVKAHVCTLCRREAAEAGALLVAPGGSRVCASCVGSAHDVLERGAGTTIDQVRYTRAADDQPCSFCRNTGEQVGPMAERSDGADRMCRACVDACRRMLEPTGAAEAKAPAMRRRKNVHCSFCNVSNKETSKIVAGPGVYICEVCVAAATSVVSGAPAVPSRSVELRPGGRDCAFCGKPRAQVGQLVAAGRGRICDECLRLCHDIMGGPQ